MVFLRRTLSISLTIFLGYLVGRHPIRGRGCNKTKHFMSCSPCAPVAHKSMEIARGFPLLRPKISTDPRILRAGVVGIGAFGRHHTAKYARLPGVELVGVADPSFEARHAVTAAHAIPALADWRDLLGKVDLVSVCSPARTHAQIVRAFLECRRPCAGREAYRHRSR